MNFAMDLKTVSIIKSSLVCDKYKTLVTMELTSEFICGSDSVCGN